MTLPAPSSQTSGLRTCREGECPSILSRPVCGRLSERRRFCATLRVRCRQSVPLSPGLCGIPDPDSVQHAYALLRCSDLRTSLLYLKAHGWRPCPASRPAGAAAADGRLRALRGLASAVTSGRSLPGKRAPLCAGAGRLGSKGLSWPRMGGMVGHSLSGAGLPRTASWHHEMLCTCATRRGAAGQGQGCCAGNPAASCQHQPRMWQWPWWPASTVAGVLQQTSHHERPHEPGEGLGTRTTNGPGERAGTHFGNRSSRAGPDPYFRFPCGFCRGAVNHST